MPSVSEPLLAQLRNNVASIDEAIAREDEPYASVGASFGMLFAGMKLAAVLVDARKDWAEFAKGLRTLQSEAKAAITKSCLESYVALCELLAKG